MVPMPDRAFVASDPRVGRKEVASDPRVGRTSANQPTAGLLSLLLVGACLTAPPVSAQFLQRPLVIKNARIIRMNGPVIENGSVVIKGRVIKAIGADVKPPLLARSVDAKGKTVTPGLIDAYSALGMTSRRSRSAGPTSKAFDAFDRYAIDDFRDALRNGVTTVYVASRGARGITGVGAVVQLARDVGESAGVVIDDDAALCVDLGSGDSPTARLKTFRQVRKQFREALQYRRQWEDYEEDLKEYEKKLEERAKEEAEDKKKGEDKKEGKDKKEPDDKEDKPEDKTTSLFQMFGGPPGKDNEKDGPKDEKKKDEEEELKKPAEPKKDRKKEALLRAIDHKLPVRIEAHRSADILNALELAEEFSLDLMLEGATDAYLMADAIADAEVPVILGRVLVSDLQRRNEFHRSVATNAAALEEAGVTWTVGSGAIDGASSRFVLFNAQAAAAHVEGGDALRRVTIGSADLLGLSRKIGHLTPGMQADLVIWSGDPSDPASMVERVYVAGKLVFQR